MTIKWDKNCILTKTAKNFGFPGSRRLASSASMNIKRDEYCIDEKQHIFGGFLAYRRLASPASMNIKWDENCIWRKTAHFFGFPCFRRLASPASMNTKWDKNCILTKTTTFFGFPTCRGLASPASMNLISHREQNSQLHKEIGPRTERASLTLKWPRAPLQMAHFAAYSHIWHIYNLGGCTVHTVHTPAWLCRAARHVFVGYLDEEDKKNYEKCGSFGTWTCHYFKKMVSREN